MHSPSASWYGPWNTEYVTHRHLAKAFHVLMSILVLGLESFELAARVVGRHEYDGEYRKLGCRLSQRKHSPGYMHYLYVVSM